MEGRKMEKRIADQEDVEKEDKESVPLDVKLANEA